LSARIPIALGRAEAPLVVATVTTPEDFPFLEDSAETLGADLLEYRIDNLLPALAEADASLARAPRPVLLTVRRAEEGGGSSLDAAGRLALYLERLEQVAVVDTEIASLAAPEFRDFPEAAREAGAELVASFHDFNRWPGIDLLRGKVDEACELGCDVVKLAVVVETLPELFELAGLVAAHRERGGAISAMGMGPLGKLSRLVLAKAGSCLNYGYLRVPNAPGQWSAARLTELLAEL